jgi:hypothetical protein
MRSRFKNVPDYFKTIDKVTAAARAFVERAGAGGFGDGFRGGALRALPAANATEWDELLHAATVFLVATDTHRIHVAPAPAALAEGVPPAVPQDTAEYVLTRATAAAGRRVTFNARYLREAIHPRANRVTLHVPDDPENDPVLVASFIEDAQIALALVMAMRAPTTIRPCLTGAGEGEGEAAG